MGVDVVEMEQERYKGGSHCPKVAGPGKICREQGGGGRKYRVNSMKDGWGGGRER